MIRITNFIRYNRDKWLTVQVWLWAAIFRMMILIVPVKYVKRYYGISEEESPELESKESYKKARKIAYYVNRISEHTPWESKCLVRALTAQRLLTKKNVTSTLYLGVKNEGNKMVAHAWLRTGCYYVTGGDGSDYTTVAKFRK